MSDEPLYCEACGYEQCIPGCIESANDDPRTPREDRYCEVCGVIPHMGFACAYYEPGGNKTGCIGNPPPARPEEDALR